MQHGLITLALVESKERANARLQRQSSWTKEAMNIRNTGVRNMANLGEMQLVTVKGEQNND